MISLPSTSHKLQAALAASGTPDILVFYHDLQLNQKIDAGEYPIGVQRTTLNGTNETDILDAPPQNYCRHIDGIHLSNDEASAITLLLIMDIGGTNYRIIRKLLAVGQSLCYGRESGFQVV